MPRHSARDEVMVSILVRRGSLDEPVFAFDDGDSTARVADVTHSSVVFFARHDDARRQGFLQCTPSKLDPWRGPDDPGGTKVQVDPVPFAASPHRKVEECQERVVGGARLGRVEHGRERTPPADLAGRRRMGAAPGSGVGYNQRR